MTETLDCGQLNGTENNVCRMPVKCGEKEVHEVIEAVIDPGSGELSGSRIGLIGYLGLAIIPILWVMVYFHQWANIEGIIKWTFPPLCGIYAASTWKKYRCNEGQGE